MVSHLDTNAISKAHKRSAGFSAIDGFNHPEFSNAGVTDTAFSNCRTVFRVLFVGYGSGTHNSARVQLPGMSGVADQLSEVKSHVCAGIRASKWRSVKLTENGQAYFSTIPGRAELIRCDCNGRKSARRFGLKKAKAFVQFSRNQIAQRDIVGQHQQAYFFTGLALS